MKFNLVFAVTIEAEVDDIDWVVDAIEDAILEQSDVTSAWLDTCVEAEDDA